MKQLSFAVSCLVLAGGCRILETGYGDDNAVVRTSTDAVSASYAAAKLPFVWAGAAVKSFGDDLDLAEQSLCIVCGEHAAAAYRNRPELPEGYRPLSEADAAALGLPEDRYRYEPETGYLEDAAGAGFGARLSASTNGEEVVVAFRGSNAPGEDPEWAKDWLVDVQQGGGALPVQYLHGAEVLAAAASV